MPKENLDISSILGETKTRIMSSLKNEWNQLYWEPEIETPSGQVYGVVIEEAGDRSEVTFLSPFGKILRATREGVSELDLQAYIKLAPQIESDLQRLRAAQWQEIKDSPEGKDVLWRPGSFLLGKFYSPYCLDYGTTDKVIRVRAKKDGLYCPDHPDEKLITIKVSSEDHEMFTNCPREDCDFSVFSGT